MLTKLVKFKSEVTLLSDTGVQLLDFGLAFTKFAHIKGHFVRKTANGPLLQLDYDPNDKKFTIPCTTSDTPEIVRPELNIPLNDSLQLLEGVWIPLPWLRRCANNTFLSGPDNWARLHFHQLTDPDSAGNTLRFCIAFDTQFLPEDDNDPLIAPTQSDVDNGTRFSLAWTNKDIEEFLDNTWVDTWLRELFLSKVYENGKHTESEIAYAIKMFEYQAHYLNILQFVAKHLDLPVITLGRASLSHPPVPVDLILDVGSTHTCGVVIEDHASENDGLRQCSELLLRNLSHPEYVSTPLFSSRLEFSEARFGKSHLSLESGREEAFCWPSIVRLGDEAQILTQQRTGYDGASGLSSPRRYLWDSSAVSQPWRFSQSAESQEKYATALPVMNLLNDEGIPLYRLPADDRLPVFTPRYSRSSLMTLMLSELLAQSLAQMNSPASRQQKGYRNSPRQIRHIVLTLPSAMPAQERERLRQHMTNAIAIVWKGLGWHPRDTGFISESDKKACKIPVPTISTDWDEASCSQLVWLYNESQRYSGHLEHIFHTLKRPDRNEATGADDERSLMIASIDIGGGTTDMSITRYVMRGDSAKTIKITPYVLFREGFKNAGDDLLLEVIQREILPAIEENIRSCGIEEAASVMLELFGSSLRHDDRSVLRQKATLQLMIPLGHAVLTAWENNQPIDTLFSDVLSVNPTANVVNWINTTTEQMGCSSTFDILSTRLRVDPAKLNATFLNGQFTLSRTLKSLSEVIENYCCDLLIVSGRPGNLPGVQSYFRRRQPVPATRIISMQNYILHSNFPFYKNGNKNNTKATAVTGAMLYRLATDLRLQGFNFSTGNLKAASTIRYFGVLNDNNLLTEENILFQQTEYFSPPPVLNLTINGSVRLGFRQSGNPRWIATPLYRLTIQDPNLARTVADSAVLHVCLKHDSNKDEFALESAALDSGEVVNCEQLDFTLCTLTERPLAVREYWIDSGDLYK